MSPGKLAVIFGLGVAAGLIIQSGDPLDSWYPVWRETGLLARAVLCLIAGASIFTLGWLHGFLFGPLELLRGPDDVGYIVENGRSKAQAANEVRRRRRTGDLPPVYPNGWYRVLDSHMLRRGEVRSVTVLGEQVAVFRGQDGEAYVVDAYCPHLGANLAVGGQVVGNCIECPFHGWQFRGTDGKCVKIPYAEKVPEFAKVRIWPSCELNGQVLVWFHCDGEDPQWLEIPENAADIAHLGHLHTPAIVSGVDLRYTNRKTWEFLRHDWKVQWEPEAEPNKHCSQMLVKHALTVFGSTWHLLDVCVLARQSVPLIYLVYSVAMITRVFQVGPGVVFLLIEHSFLGRGVILQCVTPFERDVMIWNNKKYISKPLLVKEDSAIQKHRRWFSQFYSENSPRLQHQRNTLDF
ncbi:hypothetical protein F7725_015314 [Dissostichus mawsoni]|uniref:cholesterol 7-desaturase n=1 Tax=Dissostichus mawsoni TaxID=36200 RepID=A0A7J5YJZ8_DISMA|nr:hypothetical protein F7725_015314 [Dissostichus mawsoni]